MILRDYLDAVHAEHVRIGFHSGNCDRCTPTSWHDDARAHRLRPAVVGGLPFATHERPGADDGFWARVDRSGGPDACWPWLGARLAPPNLPYGTVSRSRRKLRAHRVALELHLGRPMAPGMFACHTCDNPPCCNPAHLFEDSNSGNQRDAVAKGRHRGAPPHPLGEANHSARLTEPGVSAIRVRIAAGESLRSIARDAGIGYSTVRDIAVGRTWRIDTPPSGPGQEAQGVARDRIAGDPRVTVGGSVDQPDGDLAGARRAIASATPGRSHDTSHPDFSQGAGREASPRSSSRALRGAALATQPA